VAKLYLKFEQATLKEMDLTQGNCTIGRLPDNSLQIDNLAVSSHHAKIYWDHDHYAIEDLGSLNGTWVNNQRVGKATLKNGDKIAIGKHFVEFKDEGSQPPLSQSAAKAGPQAPKLEETVVLDTKKAQEVIAAKAAPSPTAGPLGLSKPVVNGDKDRVGLLNILEGRTDETQYVLTGKMTMIGKSKMATIRLKGFFAPKTAALISRRDNKYFIAPSEQKIKIKINSEAVSGQQELKEGDIVEVAGIKAAFSLQN
jgi:FHA domain